MFSGLFIVPTRFEFKVMSEYEIILSKLFFFCMRNNYERLFDSIENLHQG